MGHYVKSNWKQVGLVVGLLCLMGVMSFFLIRLDRKAVENTLGQESEELELPSHASLSAWDWRTLTELSDDEIEGSLEFAYEEEIKTIYLRIDSYLDIVERSDDDQNKQSDLQAFDNKLRQLVRKANEYGIGIQALAGDTDWSKPDLRYLPELVFDYVAQYNKLVAREERLRGLQFDIEPHNQPDFDKHQQVALLELIETVQIINRKKLADETLDGFALGWTLPYWFDEDAKNVEYIDFAGATKPASYHIMDLLNKSTGNYVVIMAYRNEPDGEDGAIQLSRDEVNYANKNAQKVRVRIGQETTDVEPKRITFYGKSRDDAKKAIKKIAEAFEGDKSFGGVAIHTLTDYEKLD